MPPSRNKRGSGYSQVEINSLFDLLEMHLPISSMEWERVEALHEINFPAEDRTRESLKRKFQDLYCTKIPTGNPFIPNDVRRAKEIQRMREERIHSSDCEGNQDIKNITHNAETKKDHNKNSSSTTDSRMVTLVTIESPTVASLNSAKPLVKDKKDEEERQICKREEDRKQREEERKQQQEERKQQRHNKSMMNQMIMAMIMATAPNAALSIATFMQPTNDENSSDNDEQNKEYKKGKEKQSNVDPNKDDES